MSELSAITTSWACGATTQELAPKVKTLIASLNDEALSEVFKVLPRPLALPHMKAFRDAEDRRNVNEVATLLVASNFDGCGAIEDLADTISYAVSKVPDAVLAPHAEAVFQWRQTLCGLSSKAVAGIDLDSHAKAAMIYALNAPSFLAFDGFYDTVSKVKVTRKETQLLAEFIDTVLLAGAGATGYASFEAKAGKGFFESVGVTDALRKARLLSLCVFLHGKSTVPMSEVAKALQVANAEVAQNYVVDAALANIIDVLVDRETGDVAVKSVMPLRFEAKAMEQLLKAIDENLAIVTKLQKDYNSA